MRFSTCKLRILPKQHYQVLTSQRAITELVILKSPGGMNLKEWLGQACQEGGLASLFTGTLHRQGESKSEESIMCLWLPRLNLIYAVIITFVNLIVSWCFFNVPTGWSSYFLYFWEIEVNISIYADVYFYFPDSTSALRVWGGGR